MKNFRPLLLLTGTVFLLFCQVVSPAQSIAKKAGKAKVFVMEIRSEIDTRSERYVKLALEEATNLKADYVIIDMDTYGGGLAEADAIRTRILKFSKPVFVFINKNAASAGALISIACDSIYMTPGANIGAATVVTGEGVAAPDKYQSYMRSIMRSTAQANGRNPKIAEAMVDQNLALDSTTKDVRQQGQVITFTTSEAIRNGYCEGQVNSIEDILRKNGLTTATLTRYEVPTIEKVIAFFLNPFISGVLILLIIAGLYFEFQSPGAIFPIVISAVALVLYLVPYYLNGLAANWEILLFVAGIGLLAAEVFVIPGFGVAGIAGLTIIFGSLILIMLNNNNFDFSPVSYSAIYKSSISALFGLFGALILLVVGGSKLLKSRSFRKLTLQTEQRSEEGYTANFTREVLIGQPGIAFTVLRPSGKVLINGQVYDAATRGDYIDKDTPIVVSAQEGVSLTVKRS